MKVLLYEQWHGGHYDNYMKALVPAIAPLCDRLVISVGEKMRRSADALEHWPAHPNVEFTAALPEVAPGLNLQDRWAAAKNLLGCLRAVRPDFTVIPSADSQANGVAALNALGYDIVKHFGPVEGTLHYGYGYAARHWRNRLKEFVYSQTYRRLPFNSVNFVNFTYYEYAMAERLLKPGRVRFVGDPVPQPAHIGKSAARRLLGLEPAGRYLGLLGSLDHRKAIPQLLAAFRRAVLAPDDRLLLAGRLDSAHAALIEAQYQDLLRSGRLVVMNRFLSDDELKYGYEALDVATVAYAKSPVLASLGLKAIAAGVPIVADDFGWLGAVIRRFGLGQVTDVYDADSFALSMASMLKQDWSATPTEAVRRLLAFHSEQNFVAQMTRGLKSFRGDSFGSPLSSPPLEWQWVLEAVSPELRASF